MTSKPNTKHPPRLRSRRKKVEDWISNLLFRVALWFMLRLPWRLRLKFAAALTSRFIAPVAGWRRRIRDNLAKVLPDLSPEEVNRLEREVPANVGRAFIEIYSPGDLVDRVKDEKLTGPGVVALEKAKNEGRPALLVTGHIGNYDAVRIGLLLRGYPVGGLYKPMANSYFNEHYVKAIEKIGKPMFPKSRAGMAGMLRFLREGGMLGIVLDQYMANGAPLEFMGEPALTALSAADLALKFDALIVPVYGIRRPDSGFDLIIGQEIPRGTAEEMTQALNDDLEIQVNAHPEQWIWMHRRWRPAPKNLSS
ncbi:MAG: lysophospholipid acyltransferase family protein [Arenibacterium sp.]